MKKVIIGFLFALLLIVIFINHRTPFFLPVKGGWSIGYGVFDSIPSKLNVEMNTVFSIEKLASINDSTVFLADPFFIAKEDTIYIFFEYQMKKPGADIAVMKSINGKDFEYGGVVLDEKFHLSYPYVFKYADDYYMLPETELANNILLYKAYQFPYDWKICDTLIKNVRYRDASIYLSDSVNFLVVSDNSLNLYMYQSDSLFGDWKKHKKRSIVLSGSEARAAGRIFEDKDGQITIPVQNCTKGYGYGVSLYKLNFIEDNDYEIELSNKFFLEANSQVNEFSGGMHHLDIQKYEDKYFAVYDGNYILKDKKAKFNWKFPLKASYIDTKNYFYNAFN